MYPDYINLVLEHYERKRAAHQLSLALREPTTKRINDECLKVLHERWDKKTDAFVLREFFGANDNFEEIEKRIINIDKDKFKPLINYLKKYTKETDVKNIELLAWLIDFQPRPFKYGFDYSEIGMVAEGKSPVSVDNKLGEGGIADRKHPEKVGEKVDDVREEKEKEKEKDGGRIFLIVGAGTKTESPIKETPERLHTGINEGGKGEASSVGIVEGKENKREMPLEIIVSLLAKVPKWLSVAILLILLSSGTLLYLEVNNNNVMGSSLTLNGAGGCMYWNGEEYKQITCTPRLDTQVIALDIDKLNGFKKIMKTDTLRKEHIDKVWYHKVSNTEIECFTSYGEHPVEFGKYLKPLTDRMFKKYILKED